MNGQVEQMCNIVLCARKALYENEEINFVTSKHVLSIKFVFTSELIGQKSFEADSVWKWFHICKERDLDDIKFMIPTATDDRYILGFSNTSQGLIVCFWKQGKVTCFCPIWEFDSERKGWNIVYEEHLMTSVRKENITFTNQTEEFKKVLLDIGKLATDIGFEGFPNIFHNAYEALCDFSHVEPCHVSAQVPNEFKGIYYAVETADVFGAMGSWNDSPPYYAHQKGLEKEYNELSDKLLKQLRYHMMYVVNESWQKK